MRFQCRNPRGEAKRIEKEADAKQDAGEEPGERKDRRGKGLKKKNRWRKSGEVDYKMDEDM